MAPIPDQGFELIGTRFVVITLTDPNMRRDTKVTQKAGKTRWKMRN